MLKEIFDNQKLVYTSSQPRDTYNARVTVCHDTGWNEVKTDRDEGEVEFALPIRRVPCTVTSISDRILLHIRR